MKELIRFLILFGITLGAMWFASSHLHLSDHGVSAFVAPFVIIWLGYGLSRVF